MIRGPISLLIVGGIMLFMTLLVTLGPRGFEGILPETAIRMLEGGQMPVGGGSGRKAVAGETPEDFLDPGMRADGPIAAVAGNRPVFIDDVITGYTLRVGADLPAEITTIRPISGCRPTPPTKGARVGHVFGAGTRLDLALLTYGDGTLAAAVQGFVDAYRTSERAKPDDGSGMAYTAYDVAVTETGAPVYLVLETGPGNRIFNVHLAPGAMVERVVVLGGDQVGVANLDPVVPVEVILAPALAECGIEPAYLPTADLAVSDQAAKGPGLQKAEGSAEASAGQDADAEAALAGLQDRAAAYDRWFLDSFGVEATSTRAGFTGGTISVVGPVPGENDPKAVYAPLQGAKVRTTQDQYFEIRGQGAEGEDFAARVKAIATTFAFGDLGYLRQGVGF